ncbi:MAG: PfkB family carbohydrate kinase [candidate division Zixibacteria bacterium]|nr:PfkB family carbohydrate kinase [candidate division Zixibacteria bacterium]MDH3937464.1 PfkB family carbohydrate kinase [candidate division Zixibacteria bacterium]MDH4032525.1 PfkB family carbohydrate kinase [candidate division Zixibacteria bacterium]
MITAIGNPVYDYIKTKKVEPEGRVLSGCSTNAALALAKMGADARLVGAIGDDYSEHLKSELSALGIEFRIVPSAETGGFSLNYYDDFGNRTLDLLGRAAVIGEIDPDWYHDAEAVLIGPILGEVSFESVHRIRKSFDGLFFCDPQGLIRGADENGRIFHEKCEGIEQTLGAFDIVKPNELEGQILTGIDCRQDPYQAARIIKEWGPKIVIVTLAELGSIVYDGVDFVDIPPYDINLMDSTGAGDTYMAGFTFEYLKTGGDLHRAGCYASCTSSVMIENSGPDFSMTENMIRERQAELVKLAGFKVDVGVNR